LKKSKSAAKAKAHVVGDVLGDDDANVADNVEPETATSFEIFKSPANSKSPSKQPNDREDDGNDAISILRKGDLVRVDAE
jgi:hypothetical protein